MAGGQDRPAGPSPDWAAVLHAASVLRDYGLGELEDRLARALRFGAALDACRAAAILGEAIRALLWAQLDMPPEEPRTDDVWTAIAALRAARQALAGIAYDRLLAESPPYAASRGWGGARQAAWSGALVRANEALESLPALAVRPQLLDDLRTALDCGTRRALVLGTFKRGKSTLINALLGTRLLPARMTPATAVLCTLRYAPGLALTASFVDGRAPQSLSLPELEDHVCLPDPAAGNAGLDAPLRRFRPEVAAVDIGLPWPLLRSGLEIVDSPGLNEAGEREDRTRAALDSADILVYVLSATEPLAAYELETIDRLWRDGHRTMLFAVNYANRVDEEDIPALRERFTRLLDAYRPPTAPLPLFFVAARPGLLARERGDEAAFAASGLTALHDALAARADPTEPAPLQRARLRGLFRVAAAVETDVVATAGHANGVLGRGADDYQRLATRLTAAERDREANWQANLRAEAVRRQHEERRQAAYAMIEAAIERQGANESLTWLILDMPAWLTERIGAEARRQGLQLAAGPVTEPPPEAFRDRAAMLAHYHGEARRVLALAEAPDEGTAAALRHAESELWAARHSLAQVEREVAVVRGEAQRVLFDTGILDAAILRMQAALLEA